MDKPMGEILLQLLYALKQVKRDSGDRICTPTERRVDDLIEHLEEIL